MTFTVHYKWGPRGGEIEAFTSRPHLEINVPVHLGPGGRPPVGDTFPGTPRQVYGVERYRLHREIGPAEFEYTWIRPDVEGMQGQIRELKDQLAQRDDMTAQVAELERELLDALRELTRLQKGIA